jgi:D-alanine-D-alanine ligase-like ATP-grasp enzyme
VAAFDRNHWQPFIGISGRVCVGLSRHSTILNLIKEKQKEFIRIGRYERINVTDLRITSILKRNNFDLNSILEKEQVLSLLDNANLSTGGKAIDYTNEIHPKFKDLAINATKDMDLRLCGVDILTNDIKEWSDDYIILELNGAPGLDNYASIGIEQQLVVDNLYLKILKAIENS